MELHAGAQSKLPTMIGVLRLPFYGQRRLHRTVGVEAGESIEDELPCQAIRTVPWVAFNFNAQSAAVMGAGAGDGRQRQRGQQAANCKAP
jgi:hypothetical protein